VRSGEPADRSGQPVGPRMLDGPVRTRARARGALALAGLAALAISLGGCETTAEKSAKLEMAAKL
jgi:hypothetical protein